MGRYKHPKRIELENIDLIKLLETEDMYKIAKRIGCSYTLVNKVANYQFSKLKIKNIIQSPLPLSLKDLNEFSNDDFKNSLGAWSKSKERKSIQDYKQLN